MELRRIHGLILTLALVAAAALPAAAGEGPTLKYGLETQLRAMLSHLDEPGSGPGNEAGCRCGPPAWTCAPNPRTAA
ncbi:MAG: hypothetical protein IPI34_12700 [bacterium]|nr:hypothetical protein [bacterium]